MLLNVLSGLATVFLIYLLLFLVNDLLISKDSKLKKWRETFTYFSQGLYELEIHELEQRVVKLEQELEQARRNGTPGTEKSSSLRRLAQRGNDPRGG